MDIFECSICENRYDASQRRPRSLPCGHGFCTLCIESCITRGNKSCPVCREGHGANSANDLPVSYLLEELIHKATISTSQKHESESVSEKGSFDSCPKHLGVPIHFKCRTHNVKVCHSCTVLEHNPSSCNLISLDDLMKEKKEAHIITVKKQIESIGNTEKDLNALHQKNIDEVNEEVCKKQTLEKEVKLLLTKIEQSNQEILKKQTPQKQIQDALQCCQKNRKSLEVIEKKLRAATINQFITQECNVATNEITNSQKWEETLRMELDLNVEQYALVKKDGILRCSKVLSEGGKTIIPNLSKDINPPISVKLIQESELNLTSATATVFLDLSAKGCSLGRVYIRVLANRARGQQFVMLALGTNGHTLRGANFEMKDDDNIVVLYYVNENKSKNCGKLLPITNELRETVSLGSLYRRDSNTAGFQIVTKNINNLKGFGYFGDVIAGLDVIDRATSDEFDIKDILIRECGIVLGY